MEKGSGATGRGAGAGARQRRPQIEHAKKSEKEDEGGEGSAFFREKGAEREGLKDFLLLHSPHFHLAEREEEKGVKKGGNFSQGFRKKGKVRRVLDLSWGPKWLAGGKAIWKRKPKDDEDDIPALARGQMRL